jgi:hypothetical protein
MSFISAVHRNAVNTILLGAGVALSSELSFGQTPSETPESNPISAEARFGVRSDSATAMIEATEALLRLEPATQSPVSAGQISALQKLLEATDNLAEEIKQDQHGSLDNLANVRVVMERTVLLPGIVQCSLNVDGGQGLSCSVVSLYEALLPKLLEGHTENEATTPAVAYELVRHYSHILMLLGSATSESKETCANLLVRFHGQLSAFPICQICADIATFSRSDQAFFGRFVSNHFDAIASSFRDRLEVVAQSGLFTPDRVDYLLTLHPIISSALQNAPKQEVMLHEQRKAILQETFVDKVAPHLITLWRLLRAPLGGPGIDVLGEPAFLNPMSVEKAHIHPDFVTQRVADLLAAWQGDRNALGHLYFDQVDTLRQFYGPHDAVGFMSVFMLPLVAPDPERKAHLIEALRAGLVDDARQAYIGETVDRPTQVARILGLCLISDHSYFATKANTTYDAEVAIAIGRGLKSMQEPLERYSHVVTPSQLFFLELLKVAQGGDSAASVPWVGRYDSPSQERISTRAAQALERLMLDLYECQPPHIFDQAAVDLTYPLGTPKGWGTRPIHPPLPDRVQPWKDSLSLLYEYADVIAEDTLERHPSLCSVYLLSSQLTKAATILRKRGNSNDRRNPLSLCRAVQTIRNLYALPEDDSTRQLNPSLFVDLERAVREASQTATTLGGQDLSINARLALARQYIDTLQRMCIAEFAIHDAFSNHVNNGALVGPVRRELTGVWETLGVLDRDPALRRILQAPRLDDILSQLGEHRTALETQLNEATRALGL